jgi:hypothetical protein
MKPEVQAYLTNQVVAEHQEAMDQLRNVILANLGEGFEECVSYGMLGYMIPHSVYPDGYHCDPKQPLPFANLASKKAGISLYHMGVYADANLLKWFQEEYAQRVKGKLDMGKSCIRFKKMDQIPYDLIGELFAKMSANDWIALYEKNYKR